MKSLTLTLLTYFFLLIPNVVLSETMYDLTKRNGIYYKKFSDVPFNGMITGNPQGEFKNGKREGIWVWENKNGYVNTKGFYKNGKEEGTWVTYYDNGQLSDKGKYKNGKFDGPWILYNLDGSINPKYTGVFDNGVKISD